MSKLQKKREEAERRFRDLGFTHKQAVTLATDEINRFLIRLRASGMTYREMGQTLSLCPERVRQVVCRADRMARGLKRVEAVWETVAHGPETMPPEMATWAKKNARALRASA